MKQLMVCLLTISFLQPAFAQEQISQSAESRYISEVGKLTAQKMSSKERSRRAFALLEEYARSTTPEGSAERIFDELSRRGLVEQSQRAPFLKAFEEISSESMSIAVRLEKKEINEDQARDLIKKLASRNAEFANQVFSTPASAFSPYKGLEKFARYVVVPAAILWTLYVWFLEGKDGAFEKGLKIAGSGTAFWFLMAIWAEIEASDKD